MTAIIKNKFRINAAKDFIENFVGNPIVPPLDPDSGAHNVDRNHYLGIGRSRPWPTDVPEGISDITPPDPTDSQKEDYEFWYGALGFKRVDSSLSSLGVPRYDWDASGDTIYIQYDDTDADLFAHPTPEEIEDAQIDGTYTAGSFYVMTDEFHIFKCLSNNNGAKSVNKPTLTLSAPFITVTADGYRWKYMTTITPAQSLYFLTDQWMPVKALIENSIADDGSVQYDVESQAVSGSIDSYVIDNVGSGYTNVHSGTLVSGGTAVTTAVLAVGSSASDDVYNNGTIFITSGTGAGSVRRITDYVGGTRTITIDSVWTTDATSVYEIWPTLVITGNSTNAVAKVKVHTSGGDTGKISEIVVINAGSGYISATTQILAPGGTGTGGVVRAMVSPYGGHGKNVEKELGAWYALVTVRLAYNDGSGDIPNANDYRQIALIRNLKDADGDLAYEQTLIGVKSLLLQGVTAGVGGLFQGDETITGVTGGTTAVAKVVEYVASVTPNEGTLYFWQDEGTGFVDFLDAMNITSDASFATATVKASGVVAAEVTKNSGDIIYLENRRPILRAPDQTESIQVVVEF